MARLHVGVPLNCGLSEWPPRLLGREREVMTQLIGGATVCIRLHLWASGQHELTLKCIHRCHCHLKGVIADSFLQCTFDGANLQSNNSP